MRSRNSRPAFQGSRSSTCTVPDVRLAMALEDLDGRRFAGAVLPEQGIHLARFDGEDRSSTAEVSAYCLRRCSTRMAAMKRVTLAPVAVRGGCDRQSGVVAQVLGRGDEVRHQLVGARRDRRTPTATAAPM